MKFVTRSRPQCVCVFFFVKLHFPAESYKHGTQSLGFVQHGEFILRLRNFMPMSNSIYIFDYC